MLLDPGDGTANGGVIGRHTRGDETGNDGAESVDVVGAPTSKPRAIFFLVVEQPRDAALHRVAVLFTPREGFEDVSGDVGTGRVNEFAEVPERQLATERLNVVDVKGGPSTVSRLHALHPRESAAFGVRRRLGRATKGEDNLGCVVDVGIRVVLELEGPATRLKSRFTQRPVALDLDLLTEEVARRRAQHRVFWREAGVGERGHRESGVPDGRLAGFESSARLVFDGKAFESGDSCVHDGVIKRVALETQRDERVDPGRLNTTP